MSGATPSQQASNHERSRAWKLTFARGVDAEHHGAARGDVLGLLDPRPVAGGFGCGVERDLVRGAVGDRDGGSVVAHGWRGEARRVAEAGERGAGNGGGGGSWVGRYCEDGRLARGWFCGHIGRTIARLYTPTAVWRPLTIPIFSPLCSRLVTDGDSKPVCHEPSKPGLQTTLFS